MQYRMYNFLVTHWIYCCGNILRNWISGISEERPQCRPLSFVSLKSNYVTMWPQAFSWHPVFLATRFFRFKKCLQALGGGGPWECELVLFSKTKWIICFNSTHTQVFSITGRVLRNLEAKPSCRFVDKNISSNTQTYQLTILSSLIIKSVLIPMLS